MTNKNFVYCIPKGQTANLPVRKVLDGNHHYRLLGLAISQLAPILDHVAIDLYAIHRLQRLSNAHQLEAERDFIERKGKERGQICQTLKSM